jgi:4-hydroxy-tetrahydrodipicolinate synthase
MSKLSCVIPALPTPLLENENIDEQGIINLIDYAIEQGVSSIFVLGSMGEGPSLLDSQRLLLVETAARHLNGKMPLLAGISEVSTRRALEMGKMLQDAGSDYLVTTTPYYYSFPHPDSIIEYVSTLASKLKLPLVFYHCPVATGNDVTWPVLDAFMQMPNIAAIKYSSLDLTLFLELLRNYPDKKTRTTSLLQGNEFAMDTAMLLGADGMVTGGGTLFIDTLVQLCEAGCQGDQLRAFRLQQEFRVKMDKMIGNDLAVDWVHAIKKELEIKGLCQDNPTSPFLKRKSKLLGVIYLSRRTTLWESLTEET